MGKGSAPKLPDAFAPSPGPPLFLASPDRCSHVHAHPVPPRRIPQCPRLPYFKPRSSSLCDRPLPPRSLSSILCPYPYIRSSRGPGPLPIPISVFRSLPNPCPWSSPRSLLHGPCSPRCHVPYRFTSLCPPCASMDPRVLFVFLLPHSHLPQKGTRSRGGRSRSFILPQAGCGPKHTGNPLMASVLCKIVRQQKAEAWRRRAEGGWRRWVTG